MCSKQRKADCQASPDCNWIVGKGCRRAFTPKACTRLRKSQCAEEDKECEWIVGSGCKSLGAVRKRRPSLKKKSPARRDEPRSRGDCVTRSKLVAKTHQLKVVNYLFGEKKRGVAAIYQVGSGKTLIAVIASQCFLDQNPKNRVIFIGPKSLIPNFQKEMVNYGVENPEKYTFYTFQKFQNSKDACGECSGNMVIVDEVHELRTKGTKRATNVLNCTRFAKKILLLTATPFVNDISDLNNLIAMVNGKEPLSKNAIEDLFQDRRGFEKYISGIFMVYTSSNRSGYPVSNTNHVEIEMKGDYLKKYEKVERQVVEELMLLGINDPRRFYVGLRIALLKIRDSPKIKFTMDKIKETYKKGGKIVVYSNFLESGVGLIEGHLESLGIPYGKIDGSVSLGIRKNTLLAYNSGKITVLLITKAAGAGIDLKETDTLVIMDVPWNEANLKQIMGRVVRYKSHEDPSAIVNIYILYAVRHVKDALPTADEALRGFIQKKSTASDDVMAALMAASA